jgi:leader peptidase (prepilin peptidase)/N-methyltransferase
MIANGIEPIFWTVFGLALGSFINVVIHRLPRRRSLMRPASHCVRCRKAIKFYDNIPVVSWLLLAGKCRFCRKPISWRYPLVELVVGALGYALWLKYGRNEPWMLLSLGACAALVAVAMIDWDTFLIPDELSLGLLAVGLISAPLNPLYGGTIAQAYLQAGLGGLGGFLLCFAIAYGGKLAFRKDAMGGGDIKLLAAVGAWSGALGAFDCMIVGSFFGAAYGIALLAQKKVRRSDPIPFGPFLVLGAILNFFYVLPFGFPFNY